jgi:hypothetical protein
MKRAASRAGGRWATTRLTANVSVTKFVKDPPARKHKPVRIFQQDFESNAIHIGYKNGERFIDTFCGEQFQITLHEPAPSLKGNYMCRKCCVAETTLWRTKK